MRSLGQLALDVQKVDDLIDSGLCGWKIVPKDSFFDHPTIRIDPKIFDNWLNISIEDYDRILGLESSISAKGENNETPKTWEELVKQAQANGISSRRLLKNFLENQGNQKRWKNNG